MVVSLTGETDAAAGFIYLLRPRCHRKPFRFAARFPMPTTPEQPDFVAYSPQNPPVPLPPESVCRAWDSPFPASAVAKGITH